jgi:hypothetical protein
MENDASEQAGGPLARLKLRIDVDGRSRIIAGWAISDCAERDREDLNI